MGTPWLGASDNRTFRGILVGDTVLDPFSGTATTTLAAAHCGRNSIGFEIDPDYFEFSRKRLETNTRGLFSATTLEFTR